MSAADKRLDLDELAQSVAEASYESVAIAVAVAEAVSESEVKNLNQRSELRITLPMPFAIHHSPFGAGILMNCHTHAPRGRESVKVTFLWQGVGGEGNGAREGLSHLSFVRLKSSYIFFSSALKLH